MKKLLNSGQFAEMCGTTKETLSHYERLGMFKPDKIGENKYKYYSIGQIHDFRLISTLRSTGWSLSTIKEFINNEN